MMNRELNKTLYSIITCSHGEEFPLASDLSGLELV